MKITKEIKVPEKTRTVLDYIECELCHRTSGNEKWSPRQYEITEPTVTLRVGTYYPEGGNATTTVLDICPTCFKEKLIPWFQSLGGTPRQDDSDW